MLRRLFRCVRLSGFLDWLDFDLTGLDHARA